MGWARTLSSALFISSSLIALQEGGVKIGTSTIKYNNSLHPWPTCHKFFYVLLHCPKSSVMMLLLLRRKISYLQVCAPPSSLLHMIVSLSELCSYED